jgi:imidazolonepropionase
MKILLKNPTQIVTVDGNGLGYKRGSKMNSIEVVTDHSIIINNGLVEQIIENIKLNSIIVDKTIDVTDKIILPGLVESHTHTAFAGSRAEEFKLRLQGLSYEEIAKKGGGINTTVQSIRKSSFDDLIDIIKPRVEYFISQGITTLEIKSGYGLSFYDEIKLLQAIRELDNIFSINIVPTFLGAHTFPPEYKNDHDKYIDLINNEMLPYVVEHNLAKFCDGFCESTAFSAKQIEKVFIAADSLGLKLKLHTEQFNSIGGLDVALKMNATSVDHLEVLLDEQISQFSNSQTAAVLLPGVSGSSHIANLHLIMSLGALKMGMTIEETITSVTLNSAYALDISEHTGSIEVGKSADFAIFDAKDYSEIVYNIGRNLNVMTIKDGIIIYGNNLEST